MSKNESSQEPNDLLKGRSAETLALYAHFIREFGKSGKIGIHPAKTMIGITNGHRRIAWITQLGKNFIHVVFPFKKAYNDNLCFQKIAQVPGDATQFNHHFRMLHKEDVNEEVKRFMKIAWHDEH